MADLTEIQSSANTKLIGSDTAGSETTPVQASTGGGLHVNLRDNSGTELGTAANPVRVDPTGTTAQPISMVDTAPANQSITALDVVTSTFVGANSQNFYTGTPTAGSAASFSLSSIENVNIQATLIGTGGTMVVEVSQDGGVFWFRPNTFQVGTQNFVNSFTSPFEVSVNTAGMTNIRVRSTVSWSGTATIAIRSSMHSRTMVVTDSVLQTPMGALTETAPASDTASSGINGRLQRIAQRLTSLIALIPSSIATAFYTRISDGTDTVGISQNSELKVVDGLRNGGVYAALNIPTANTPVEAKVGASRLTNRKFIQITIENNGIFWGLDSSVTITTGIGTANGQVLSFAIDPDSTFQIWLVGNANNKNVHVVEVP